MRKELHSKSKRNQTGLKKAQLGQGMVEYIIIVALVGLASIVAFKFFGDTARQQVASMSEALSGQDSDNKKAVEAAKGSRDNADNRGLSNFGQGASTAAGAGGGGNGG